MSTTTGRAMTLWAIRSQRDSRGGVRLRADRPAERAPDRGRRGRATRSELTRGPSMPEHRRQERQRVEDGRGDVSAPPMPNERRAARLEQQQPGQPDRDRQPGERDGLAAGRDGDLDGAGRRPARRSSSRNRLTMNSE